MPSRPECQCCGQLKVSVDTAHAGAWVCPGCDQYPWIIQPMTDQGVMNQDAKASRAAREYQTW